MTAEIGFPNLSISQTENPSSYGKEYKSTVESLLRKNTLLRLPKFRRTTNPGPLSIRLFLFSSPFSLIKENSLHTLSRPPALRNKQQHQKNNKHVQQTPSVQENPPPKNPPSSRQNKLTIAAKAASHYPPSGN